MELKENQKQGIGLFLVGISTMLGVLSIYLSEAYKFPALAIAILLYFAGAILLLKGRK